MHPEKVDSAWRPELSEMVVRLVRSDEQDRKSTRLNSSHSQISYAVFCLKKKKNAAALTGGWLKIFSVSVVGSPLIDMSHIIPVQVVDSCTMLEITHVRSHAVV